MLNFEDQYYSDKINIIVGCDEAGRGPLAGPVVAAAVILPKGYKNDLINDSKKLTEKQREKVFLDIIKNSISFALTYIDSETIDKINILEASRKAMSDSIKKLKTKPDLIVTDAMYLYGFSQEIVPIIKGDAKCECIAAASIIAKVCRDRYMKAISSKYPQYNFQKNKGYGTKDHLEALNLYGPIKGFHRFSFAPVRFSKIKLF